MRLIDPKSVSIMIRPEVSRESRVTIAGDIAIKYDAIEDDDKDKKSFASTNVSKEYVKEKYVKTFREIHLTWWWILKRNKYKVDLNTRDKSQVQCWQNQKHSQ